MAACFQCLLSYSSLFLLSMCAIVSNAFTRTHKSALFISVNVLTCTYVRIAMSHLYTLSSTYVRITYVCTSTCDGPCMYIGPRLHKNHLSNLTYMCPTKHCQNIKVYSKYIRTYLHMYVCTYVCMAIL